MWYVKYLNNICINLNNLSNFFKCTLYTTPYIVVNLKMFRKKIPNLNVPCGIFTKVRKKCHQTQAVAWERGLRRAATGGNEGEKSGSFSTLSMEIYEHMVTG